MHKCHIVLALSILLASMPSLAYDGAGLTTSGQTDATITTKKDALTSDVSSAGADVKVKDAATSPNVVPAGCVIEDLNWCPGLGGPQVSLPNQANRSQAQDTIIAYRITSDQLGSTGWFDIYDMNQADIGFSNKPCDANQLDDVKDMHCQRGSMKGRLTYYDAADASVAGPIQASQYAYGYCPIPKPIDKYNGKDILYLNVRVPKICAGGGTWFCNDHSHLLQSSDPDENNSRCVMDQGYCGRAIGHEMRGPAVRVCNNYSADGSANDLPVVVGCQTERTYFQKPPDNICASLNLTPAWHQQSQTSTHYWQGGASCVDCQGYQDSHPDWDKCVTWETSCCPP